MPTVRTGDFDCFYADDWFGPAWEEPEAIVIQAGFGRNGEYWRHWVPGLAGTHRVLRRDQRGHGGSTAGDPAHQWTPDALADELMRGDQASWSDALRALTPGGVDHQEHGTRRSTHGVGARSGTVATSTRCAHSPTRPHTWT